MITELTLHNFKRFGDLSFSIPGHVVLAGPNNTGKTTLLQALATWSLALARWRMANDFNPRKGYVKVPMTRSMFSAVPLRNFELLWNDRKYAGRIEIGVRLDDGRHIVMELESDSSEQIYVKPRNDVDPEHLRAVPPRVAYVPPMTGLSVDEPVYQRAKIEQLLGLGKPGEVIRNLLLLTHQDDAAWARLTDVIRRLFNFELLPPDGMGADIVAEYQRMSEVGKASPRLDIGSAGSGFQQVLLLMTFLHAKPGTVLLLDEPDAHLHVILQDAIYHELKSVAERDGSQLIAATHSEVIIDAVEPDQLFVVLNEPRKVADNEEKRALIRSLKVLDNADIMRALVAPGILYVEGHTDLALLREWARVLNHKVALELLEPRLFWRPTVWEPRHGANGIKARDHFEALQMLRPDLPGLILLDGDDNPNIPDTPLTGCGLQRLRWRRYEIESYLFHPQALARYVKKVSGSDENVAAMQRYISENHLPGFLGNLFSDPDYIKRTKARTDLIPPVLKAAGVQLPYTRYAEIAGLMQPDEVHPEVWEKLDGLCAAFGVAHV
jgi:predicted ATPase